MSGGDSDRPLPPSCGRLFRAVKAAAGGVSHLRGRRRDGELLLAVEGYYSDRAEEIAVRLAAALGTRVQGVDED
ncbi:hypothetical protein [Actinoplanes sp. NBRC 101535]|uniref:hypothetical protein n=1 Tax=Actinoplanes sp. NBRC 101535 TaxID=3032196 RepID=UPI0025559163|nr:hypothetical protein [Actinoplanes sp. NBRC 101535]